MCDFARGIPVHVIHLQLCLYAQRDNVPSSMLTPHACYLAPGSSAAERQKRYRGLIAEAVDQDVIANIRHCANSGLVLGSEKFRLQAARMLE